MRSHVFLTPMGVDGTPGKEVLVNDEAPKFLEPVSPYAVNDAELSKLRSAVSDAETALRHAKSKNAGAAEITRLDKALTTAKRDLDIVEYELRRKRQRETGIGADSPFARQTLAELVASTVAGVEKLVGKAATHEVKNNKKAADWKKILADFDASQAARLATNLKKKVCCTGQYLCSKCQAKATA